MCVLVTFTLSIWGYTESIWEEHATLLWVSQHQGKQMMHSLPPLSCQLNRRITQCILMGGLHADRMYWTKGWKGKSIKKIWRRKSLSHGNAEVSSVWVVSLWGVRLVCLVRRKIRQPIRTNLCFCAVIYVFFLPSVRQRGRHRQPHASHMTKVTWYARTWLVERKVEEVTWKIQKKLKNWCKQWARANGINNIHRLNQSLNKIKLATKYREKHGGGGGGGGN